MKQKIKYIIFAVLLGVFIGFLYNLIVIPDSCRKEMFLYKDSIKLRNLKYINKTYLIHHKETLLLKIVSSSIQKTITFNNKILTPYKTKTYHRKLKNLFTKVYSKPVDYVLIPADIVNADKNYLKLSFPPDIRDCATIKLENYEGNSSNRIFILFKDSHILLLKRSPVVYLYSTLIVLLVFLFLLWATREHIYSKFLVSLLPANILFLLAYIIHNTFSLRLVITSDHFWTLQAVSLGIVLYFSIIIRCLRYLIRPFWKWLKPRPFSDKCIVLFMFLLIACALFLVANSEIAAERLANVAYFALCFGVIIKFVQMVKERDR